jgi:ketosteroid isomerase-like protein
MKRILFILPLIFCFWHVNAQSTIVGEEIKKLEQMEVQAILAKDTLALKKIWDKNFVVNAPNNQVVEAKENSVDRPVLSQARTGFTREVEYINVRGDNVISMGSETVIPGGNLPNSGQTVKRRFTHIWMKVDGEWKLAVRHANVVCENK